MVNFKVHVDGLQVALAKAKRQATEAEHKLAQQIKDDTEQFVPMLTGSLTNRTRVQNNLVIYPGPYARFLYYGKVMIYPPTGSTWAPRGERKVVTDRDLKFNQTFHKNAQSHWFEASKAVNKDKWIKDAERFLNGK